MCKNVELPGLSIAMNSLTKDLVGLEDFFRTLSKILIGTNDPLSQ